MTVKHHVVTEQEANQRIDALLAKISGHSRQQVQTFIKDGLVKVNDRVIKPSYKCMLKDDVVWQEPEEETYEIKRENIPLDVVHEDDDIIVINKARGMITHPTPSIYQGTLVNALLNYPTSLSNLSGDDRPGIVHRLDKETSGLLVVAKHNQAHENLVDQFKARTVQRKYEAIVHGAIKHHQGIIKAPIGRSPANRQNMTVIDTGREAETHFEVIEQYHNYTHVRCELKTGRTHQIRVHMRHIGHPLVGDLRYGYRRDRQMDGHLLFAQKLSFSHPKTGKWVTYTVQQPTYFSKMLQKLLKSP